METNIMHSQRLKVPILSVPKLNVGPKEENGSEIILGSKDEKVVDFYLKWKGEESSTDDEFIESTPLEKIENEKEDPDQINNDNTFANDVMGIDPVKKETNDVNEMSTKELLNHSHESSFKLEVIKQEEVHIKHEEDDEDRLRKKKYNEEESGTGQEFIDSTSVERNEKGNLDQKEVDLSLSASSNITFKKIQIGSIIDRLILMHYRNIDNEFGNDLMEITDAVKRGTNDVNEIPVKELLNYSHESSFKSEVVKQEEVHIKQKENKEDRLNKRIRNSGNQLQTITSQHQSIKQKKSNEIDWYTCQECPYKTVRKSDLKRHTETHKNKEERRNKPRKKIHQCPECPYKTAYKGNIKVHAETHSSNDLILKCSECSYETSRPTNFKTHQIKHKLDVQWLHCFDCSYKTHRRDHLRHHVLAHRRDAFKCSNCPYQTGIKKRLVVHQAKHESIDNWYSCPLCSYKSHDKRIFKSHCRTRHGIDPKNPKQIEILECTECSYKSGCKLSLKKHQKVHDRSNWLQCPSCIYKTPRTNEMKKHQVRHQGENAEGWHRCQECPYKTPTKYNLGKHVITHKSKDEIHWFECSQCSFKAAHKKYLRQHQVRKHKEIEWFFCYECSVKMKHKSNLSRHIMLKHKKQIG